MGYRGLGWVIQLTVAIIFYFAAMNVASADVINDRMSLIQAIDAVRKQGIEVNYSDQLVKPWMRVRFAPANSDPVVALRDAVAEYHLDLQEGPGHRWLIVSRPEVEVPQVYFVRGRVTDATSAEPLIGVMIKVGRRQTRTGSDGQFELAVLLSSDDELLIIADGYIDVRTSASAFSELMDSTIRLQPVVPLPLAEITVIASRHTVFSRGSASGQFLTGEEVRQMPHIADDAFRALHRLPGVAANDFQAPFNLRGGAIDEVKVVMDGLELFEPYHMRTLFSPLSIIDPGIIGQAQILSGGFTAEYGNQLSGVIEISSERPTGESVHQVGVSFVSSFVRSSGTFAADRATYQLSARRGYLDLIADSLTDDGEELSPRYNDVFANLGYRLNDSVDITAHVLSASDDVHFVDVDDGEDSGGTSSLDYAWFTIDVESAEGTRLTTRLFTGRVETTEDGTLSAPPTENIDRFFNRKIDVSGLQSDFSWQFSNYALWKMGARYRNLSADYDYRIDSTRQTDFANGGSPYTLVRTIFTAREGDEYGAYAAIRFQNPSRLTWELGLRWDKQTYSDTTGATQLSPRVNGLFEASDRTEIRLGWGRYHQPQGIQDLQVQDGVTSFFPAQRAEHRVVGIRHQYETGIEVQADFYEKRYRHLRPRFENALDTYEFAPESNFDRVRVEPGNAKSRGMELTLRNRQSDSLDWWLNYTWSRANDVIDGINVARSWDQRHAVTGNVTWRGDKWVLSTIARYHSGWPRTPLLVVPSFDNQGTLIGLDGSLSQRNSSRYDSYSRLDIRLSRNVELKHGNFQYYLEIYNVFDSSNECCVPDHDLDIGPSVTVSPNVDDFLPFFPSFGFVWTFGPGINRSPQ